MIDRDEFVKSFKLKLDEWSADIVDLEDRAARASATVREGSAHLVDELNEKRDEITQELKKLGQAVGDAWKDLREGLEEAGGSLHDGIVDAKNRFRHHDGED